jgi:hypothetical protein
MEANMNIVPKLFGKVLVAIATSSLVATTVLASPNQLDILGLVPGVSELSEVKQAGSQPLFNPNTVVILEIGGYEISCSMSFLNDKLALLACPTGVGSTGTRYTKASNTEVHSTLKAGFTKKFGKPNSVFTVPVRTGLGVKYEQEVVTWKDMKGNELILSSITDTPNNGLIILRSSEYLKEEAEKKVANETRKKF